MTTYNYRDIEWGPDEAKGDRNIANYFLKIPEYDEIISGQYRYLIGRKGTGKTAIIEKLKYEVDQRYNFFGTSLSLRDFPLPLIRKLRDKTYRDKSQFVPVWKFLILIEICKLVISDKSCQPRQEVDALKRFLNENFPQDFTIVDTLVFLEKRGAKLSISQGFFGGEATRENTKQSVEEIHYQKASREIEKKLKIINSESSFFLFFDELDEGFRSGDSNLRLLLLSLLRSIEDIYLEFKDTGLPIRPVVALRSDIFECLEDNDLNKLDDYIVRLNWKSGEVSGYSLKSLVNRRINASLEALTDDGWGNVVDNNSKRLPGRVKTAWHYISNRTFERPRDIVKFLKCCQKENKKGKLLFDEVKKAEEKYSSWFYNELRDEISSHLPVWKECLQAITKVGRAHFPLEELKTTLIADKKIVTYMTANNLGINHIVETLFNFSVLGNISDKGRWLFKYKDHDLPWDEKSSLIVHLGFSKKLRVFRL